MYRNMILYCKSDSRETGVGLGQNDVERQQNPLPNDQWRQCGCPSDGRTSDGSVDLTGLRQCSWDHPHII
jgi:hypothetical protein